MNWLRSTFVVFALSVVAALPARSNDSLEELSTELLEWISEHTEYSTDKVVPVIKEWDREYLEMVAHNNSKTVYRDSSGVHVLVVRNRVYLSNNFDPDYLKHRAVLVYALARLTQRENRSAYIFRCYLTNDHEAQALQHAYIAKENSKNMLKVLIREPTDCIRAKQRKEESRSDFTPPRGTQRAAFFI